MLSLFLELASAAREADLLDEFLEAAATFYPDLVGVAERMGPTIPAHSARRGDEMRELEQSIERLGQRPGFAREARRMQCWLGEHLAATEAESLREIIDAVADARTHRGDR